MIVAVNIDDAYVKPRGNLLTLSLGRLTARNNRQSRLCMADISAARIQNHQRNKQIRAENKRCFSPRVEFSSLSHRRVRRAVRDRERERERKERQRRKWEYLVSLTGHVSIEQISYEKERKERERKRKRESEQRGGRFSRFPLLLLPIFDEPARLWSSIFPDSIASHTHTHTFLRRIPLTTSISTRQTFIITDNHGAR